VFGSVWLYSNASLLRFFPLHENNENDVSNPLPGTIVDETVVHKDVYDFFLISQLTRMGSVSPTYYMVVSDDAKLPYSNLQMLTYKLCHMYYNWPGTISVPAPCRYASKAALFHSSIRLNRPAHQILSQVPYYL